MAAPTYGHDLSDVTLAEAATNWAALTATGWTGGGAGSPSQEGDYFIQGGSYCVSRTYTKTGVGGMIYNNTNGITVPSDGAILVWQYFAAPNCLHNEANGGQRVVVGNSTAAFYGFITGGSDADPNPYGGWTNAAVDPNTVAVRDYTAGSPSGTWSQVGIAINCPTTTPAKGNPLGVDAIRYGRCEARFQNGDLANGYCTFAGFAAVNDAVSARLGLISAVRGGYLWKGLLTIGYNSVAADFRDSNLLVMVQNTKKVSANFNKIEIRVATSRVDWTNITFLALGTVSKGRLEVVDDADVNINSCTFNGMDTLIFKAASEVLNSNFIGCNVVTANSANLSGTKFSGFTGAADSSQIVWDTNVETNGKLDGCSFTKGTNATHAIQLGTNSPTSVSLNNIAFNGYNAANGQNDSTILVSRTVGTVTINVSGCSGNISYKSAGATVVIASNPVTVKVTVMDTAVPPVAIQNARLLVLAYSGGPMPYNVTVTITNSGTTATVSHSSHGMVTNDKVQITGASLWQNNGVFTITKINDNSYSYTMPGAPGSNPTGTIKATYAALEGLTGVDGSLSTSRSFTTDQPITGRARQASSAPYKKTTDFTGTIKSSTGMDQTVQLLPDQ